MATPLPALTYEMIEAELSRLVPGRISMIRHLLAGLKEDSPSLTAEELLHELLTIMRVACSPPRSLDRPQVRASAGPTGEARMT